MLGVWVSSCRPFFEDGCLPAGCGNRLPLLFVPEAALAVILTDPETATDDARGSGVAGIGARLSKVNMVFNVHRNRTAY